VKIPAFFGRKNVRRGFAADDDEVDQEVEYASDFAPSDRRSQTAATWYAPLVSSTQSLGMTTYSPTNASARFNTESERYMPESRMASNTGRAALIRPRCLATRTSPKVPRTGIL
jgi:hypothetical protein